MEYLTKAIREAKSRTTWTAPDEPYEGAVLDAARQALVDPTVAELFSGWELRTRAAVRAATLGTKLVQLTLPGIPDVYQGTEVPNPVLVDPDNRRPVDRCEPLVARLARLDDGAGPRDLADEKLLVTSRALRLRRSLPEAFVGPDERVPAAGPLVRPLAHLRPDRRGRPRAWRSSRPGSQPPSTGSAGWADHTVALPDGDWHDVLTDRPVTGGGRRRRTAAGPAARRPARPGGGLRRCSPASGRRPPHASTWSSATSTGRCGRRRRLVGRRRRPARTGPTTPSRSTAATARPDPRSAWQPHGVHGASRVYDPATFAWTDDGWSGVDVRGHVTYELHVGTFTTRARSTSAIEHLDELVSLGVDLVELMPVPPFSGVHGWGYDGVATFAVHEPYGGPPACRRSSTPRTPAASASAWTSCTTTWARRATTSATSGPYFTDAHQTPWGPRSTWTGRVPTRSAAGCATARCAGSATSTWTPCAWTPCTR